MNEKITREEVRHVAELARLELSEEEERQMTEKMNQVLTYMEKLNSLDTSRVPHTTHAVEIQNVFRPDEVQPSMDREQILTNAPETDGVSFLVPKVI